LALIIPGVEIKVVKEIVPQQLHPSGIVGLIGTATPSPETEILPPPPLAPTPVTSYKAFTEKFGSDTTQSLVKEARLCFLNGVFEVFATRLEAPPSKSASVTLKDADGNNAVKLEAKIPGEAGNNIKVGVIGNKETVTIQLINGKAVETFAKLMMDKTSDLYIVKVLNDRSNLIYAADLVKSGKPRKVPAPVETSLTGGVTAKPSEKDYEQALETLEMEETIDMVMACDCWDPKIHALVDAHCQNMSKAAKPRIGIGTVEPGEKIEDIIKRTEVLASDRFVVVAPYGVAGGVAGLVSKLSYYESPTFKPLTGIAELEQRYTPAQLMQLLNAGILPVEARRGRGIIVIKGISTSKEQISVTRVADHAVLVARNVCEDFIGTLNTAGGRNALRQKLIEFLTRMEKEESIVPSVDGTQPSFLVDVYSSQLDFAQGIVRVDIAVRPVRAMDYIYATITVQA